MRSVTFGVLIGLAGCGGTPDRDVFEADFAEAWCGRQEECALGEFEDRYSDFDDCVSDKEDDLNIRGADDAGCEVDREEAGDCLEFMTGSSCGDWEQDNIEEACDQVFVEC